MKTRLVNKFIIEDYGKQLLQERGIKDVNKFLHPDITRLQSWRDLENIHKGVEVILKLCSIDHPKIGLIVDSDADK